MKDFCYDSCGLTFKMVVLMDFYWVDIGAHLQEESHWII